MARKTKMPCDDCGKDLREGLIDYHIDVGKTTFTARVPALICENCDEELADGPAMVRAEIDAAVALTGYPPTPDAFRFLRVVARLKATDLADLLDVAPETISRWENGKREIDHSAWLLLGSVVADVAAGVTTTLDRLRAARDGRGKRLPKKLRLEPA